MKVHVLHYQKCSKIPKNLCYIIQPKFLSRFFITQNPKISSITERHIEARRETTILKSLKSLFENHRNPIKKLFYTTKLWHLIKDILIRCNISYNWTWKLIQQFYMRPTILHQTIKCHNHFLTNNILPLFYEKLHVANANSPKIHQQQHVTSRIFLTTQQTRSFGSVTSNESAQFGRAIRIIGHVQR